jgi:hypothetical protein
MVSKLKILITLAGLLLLFRTEAQAQHEKLAYAVSHVQSGEVDKAKSAIDSAVADPVTSTNYEAWYLKGYIYRELYKKYDAPTRALGYRTEAVDALKKSILLDSAKQNLDVNRQNLRAIAGTFYNDAVSFMDTTNCEKAVKYYNLFRETMVLAEPQFNFEKRDIEFKLALATQYTKLYDSNRKKNEQYFTKTKDLYADILKIDPNNVRANYNMGLLYYNQAVNIINEMDYDVDIFTLSNTQDNTIVLFKQSLPYMEKAYQLDPQRKETLIGLSGIYFSLNEEEKYKFFQSKAQEVEKK